MTLRCNIQPLSSVPRGDMDIIATSLCWPDSDFHAKLTGSRPLDERDGTIAVVCDDDKIVGWARTEPWTDSTGWLWPTLEAFVDERRRREGVAAFATAGLVVSSFAEEGYGCAVFSPAMLLVAARAGLHPTLFERRPGAGWMRSAK